MSVGPTSDDDDESVASTPSSPTVLPIPPLPFRWVHAGALHLDLLPTPITSASTLYKPFSADESLRIEERWLSMTDEERRNAVTVWGAFEGEGAPAMVKGQTKPDTSDSPTQNKAKGAVHSLNKEELQDRLDGNLPEKEEVMSGPEQAKHEEVDIRYKDFLSKLQRENDDYETIVGVPVSQDSLFEVSLPSLSLHPVFWTHSGPRVPVLRGTWFVGDETRPCSWELAEELEKAYQEIRPWQPSYGDELATALSVGKGGEDKLKYDLPAKFGYGLGIIFDDGDSGRLITTGAMTYLARTFWSSLRAKSSGTYVYRGYEAARAASGKHVEEASGKRSGATSRRGSSSSQRSNANTDKDTSLLKKSVSRDRTSRDAKTIVGEAVKSVTLGEKELLGAEKALKAFRDGLKGESDPSNRTGDREALEEEVIPMVDSDENDTPCTDLILVIHGIGQQLATQYESYSFVYAGNQLRQMMRKQVENPALASIIRDRRCQVLPVQWRASLNLEEEKSSEDKQHGMDNRFTMADITINKSIPVVRELTNSVLLDIPLYMSHHRQKMIEAVCTQANRLYRLWVARNPDFERHGRVHIIGHSLGSALAAHILSNQPTKMPPLEQLPRQVITKTRDRFLFNTSNLFLCGSPLGIFLHLDQTQIMPRKGRERTMHSPQDEALDRSGKFGCMSIDSLYNIFYFTDPIAYQLNATVDVRLAAKRPPLAITSVTAPFYSKVTEGISRYLPPLPPLPAYLGGGAKDSKPQRPSVIRLPSGIEMSGPSGEERLEGSRAERRFSALNPHGNIDFYLPSAGVSEYLDMITAHASYWTDASFAAFLLAEIFSTRLDLLRTGMGLALQKMPEGTTV